MNSRLGIITRVVYDNLISTDPTSTGVPSKSTSIDFSIEMHRWLTGSGLQVVHDIRILPFWQDIVAHDSGKPLIISPMCLATSPFSNPLEPCT